jgi:hypothetical protein
MVNETRLICLCSLDCRFLALQFPGLLIKKNSANSLGVKYRPFAERRA